MSRTRREFLTHAGAIALGAALPQMSRAQGPATAPARSRVVIARDDVLTRSQPGEQQELLNKLLAAAMQRLTGAADAKAAWRTLFSPSSRIGLKVNMLGHTTRPAVADAIVAGLRHAGVPAENIIIWERTDSELTRGGFKINKSGSGVQCFGTDAERRGSGYQQEVETSGRIGSCFSKIVAEQVDCLISVPVLKDHELAGVTLGMKNFFGAIHNPNKYHDHCCDPYIVDVVAHRFIRPKWKLTVCDGTTAQYNGGPVRKDAYVWKFGGLLVSTDFVAMDAVGADIIDQKRREKGLKPLAEEKRSYRYIATAAERGLGIADLSRIDRVEV
jgi:uncharacterized protein (DUF362 family)